MSLGAAGLLCGAATGLKLTNGAYAVGLAIAATWAHYRAADRDSPTARRGSLSVLTGGLVAGFAATAGWWALYLWRTTGNPLFPYYNSVFRSALLPARDVRDNQFLPPGLGNLVRLPWALARGSAHVLEQPVRDGRWLLLLVLLAAVGVHSLRRARAVRAAPRAVDRAAGTLAIFTVVSTLTWVIEFRYLRYLIPIELLSGIVLALLLSQLLRRRAQVLVAFLTLGLALLVWQRVPDWGHARGFGPNWFALRVGVLTHIPPRSLVVSDQDSGPTAYAATWLPADAHLLGISQAIATAVHPDSPAQPGRDLLRGTGLDRAVRDELQQAQRTGRSVFVLRGRVDPSLDLAPFGIILDADCQVLGGRADPVLELCPAHVDSSRIAGGPS